jgi:hypothetical protein
MEDEEEGNFVQQEHEASKENTKKPGTEGQHFEYIDVASIKEEPCHVFEGEPGDSFDCEGMKEEVVEGEISVQGNDVCVGEIEAHR